MKGNHTQKVGGTKTMKESNVGKYPKGCNVVGPRNRKGVK